MRNHPWWVHPALLSAGLLYGANYGIAKGLMPMVIGPFGLNLIRVLTAIGIFWILGLTKSESIDRKDYWRLALCALFGASLNITLFFKGLSMTTPVNAALIVTTSPVVVLFISMIFRGERVDLIKIIGVIMGLTGAVFLINTNDLSLDSESYLGDIIVLVNITFYSIYLVLVKPLMAKYHPFTILKWMFTLGLIIVLPVGFTQLSNINLLAVGSPQLFALIYVAISTTVLAYLLNVRAIKYVTSSTVGYYIYLQPLFAGLIEIFKGEQILNSDLLISAGLIFIGVFLVSRRV